METIVVCGATGKQGSAVLNSLLDSKKFKIVALTRHPESKKALAIKKKGVEVQKADLQNKASLLKAFEHAYGVYGVTTPETAKGKIDPQMEKVQGFNIVDACLENSYSL